MASIQLAITLTPEEKEYIEERNLSPTQLLKEKIHEIMALSAHAEILLHEEQRKRAAWTKTAERQRIFMEKRGILDEFLKEGEVFNQNGS